MNIASVAYAGVEVVVFSVFLAIAVIVMAFGVAAFRNVLQESETDKPPHS